MPNKEDHFSQESELRVRLLFLWTCFDEVKSLFEWNNVDYSI